MPKKLPEPMDVSAKARTSDALRDLENAQQQILRETLARKLPEKKITRSYVLARAGLNGDFLKGPKHRDTTRHEVQAFVNDINLKLAEAREIDADEIIAMLKEEIRELESRHERLRDTVNRWARRVRDTLRQIRDLTIINEKLMGDREDNVVAFTKPNK